MNMFSLCEGEQVYRRTEGDEERGLVEELGRGCMRLQYLQRFGASMRNYIERTCMRIRAISLKLYRLLPRFNGLIVFLSPQSHQSSSIPPIKKRHTQMKLSNAQIEQSTRAALHLDTLFIEFLRTLKVTLFEFVCTRFEEFGRFEVCGVYRGGGGSESAA
jgi:hypothetical protein